MKINKLQLLRHLERVYCDGQVGQVVLEKDLSVQAQSPDARTLVFAPALGEYRFPKRIGVPSITKLRNVLRSSVCDQEDVYLEFVVGDDKSERLEVEGQQGQRYSLICTSARAIGTTVHKETAKQAQAELAGGGAVALPKAVVDGVLEAITATGAERVTVSAQGKEGLAVVGDDLGDYAKFPFATKFKKSASYSAVLEAGRLAAVLKQVTDFTQAQIIFLPSGPLGIDAGDGYTYVIIHVDEE